MASSAKELIRQFIAKKIVKKKEHVDIDDHYNVISGGIIDSLGIMQLVEYIEGKFQMKVEDEDITPDNFESIKSISSFIERTL